MLGTTLDVDRLLAELARTRLYDLYPEEGELSRFNYPKHMEFFEAGAVHQERAYIGGNRCLTLATPLETGVGSRLVGEMLFEEDFGVRSWADGSVCDGRGEGLFQKGIEPAFRVYLDSGEFFDCSRRHRVLTLGGWLSLDLLIRGAGGLRCWRRPEDYRDSCGEDDRRDGGRLPFWSDSDRGSPRSGGRVPRPSQLSGHWGGEGHRSSRSRVYRGAGHLPKRDGLSRLADQSGRWAGSGERCDALWSQETRRGLARFARELGRFRDVGADRLGTGRSTGSRVEGDVAGRRAAGSRFEFSGLEDLGAGLSGQWYRPGEVRLGLLPREPGLAILPAWHEPLAGGERVAAVVPLGLQLIMDFTVPGFQNYRTGGVFHHNTGKSFCVCYESTCHLIGWYPEWWQGRRFDRPVNCWAAGEDSKAVRESLQPILLGVGEARGTGLIPGNRIGRALARGGIPDAIDFVEVMHSSGGLSRLVFKAYEQGRESFQASKVDVIVLDEEPPLTIYTEALTRTMATVPGEANGIVMCAFTPLNGISDTVLQFLPGGQYPQTEALRKEAWGWVVAGLALLPAFTAAIGC